MVSLKPRVPNASVKEIFMKSARLLSLCVLLASQLSLAQIADTSGDPAPASSPRSAATARRTAHAH
jgi:hypothetical protein